jgi:hypothetical protein
MTEPQSESQESWADVAAKLESELDETNGILADLRARLNAVNIAMIEQPTLTQEYQQRSEALASSSVGADVEVHSREALIHDLQTVKERLAQIHVTLESQLFSVKDLGPIFWQVARFVGLGIVIGAILRGLVR